MRITARSLCLLFATWLLAPAVLAAPGDLDPAFGNAGQALFDRGHAYREGTSIALQGDGKYLVSGVAWGWETLNSPLLRFNADHSLDTSYAYRGQADGFGIRTAVKVLGGKALATENKYEWVADPVTTAFYRDVLIARYNADGSLDETFGTAGRTLTFNAGTGGEQRLNGFGIAPGGKLVAAGWTNSTAGNTLLLVVRYNADGTLDTSFGTGGKLTFGLPGQPASYQEIRGIDVDYVDGKIMVAGFYGSPRSGFRALLDANGALLAAGAIDDSECNAVLLWAPSPAAKWRVGCGVGQSGQSGGKSAYLFGLDGAGNHDLTFAASILNLGSPEDAWRGLSVNATDGKIYAVGYGGAGRLVVGAFNTNGTADTAFGTGGVYVMPESEFSSGAGIAAPGGEVVATGVRGIPGGPDTDIPVVVLSRTAGTRTSVTFHKGSSSTSFGDIRLMPNGQVMIGGTAGLGSTPNFLSARLNASGTLDMGYGIGGYSLLAIPNMVSSVGVRDMVVQPDGKVLMTGDFGGWYAGQMQVGAARLGTSGTGDPAFNAAGTPGYNFVNSGSGNAYGRSVRLQADGKVVAAGSGFGGGTRQIAVTRFNADGTLDSSYGSAGIGLTGFGSFTNGRAIDLTSDGKVVAAGDGAGEIRLARFTTAGQLDAAFGVAGVKAFPMPAGYTLQLANKVYVLSSGKIFVLASVFSSTGIGAMAIRMNSDGSLDTSFGEGNGWGYVQAASGAGARANFFSGAVMPNGKLVAVGYSSLGSALRGTAVRFTADGLVDLSFGGAGVRYYDDALSFTQLLGVSAAADGALYMAGNYQAGSERLGVVLKTVAETAVATSDFNADSKSDLLWRNSSTGQVYRMFMDGFAIAGQGMAYAEPNTAWKIVGDADFNGDGVADLVWRNDSTGQVYVMPFASSGMPAGGAVVHVEPNAAWKIVHTPDLDGDGKADLLWWNSSTGQVYAMMMNGTAVASQGFVYTEPNTAWKIAAVGDFAGSGKKNQLLWRNSSTGQVFLMTVTAASGSFSQTGAMIYHEPNTAWKVIAAADFNADGKSDLLWRNDSTGQVYLMLMNGGAIANQAMVHHEPNLAWKVVAQGDYNGDGMADLLWRNESTGQIYMMLMNGLAIASQAMIYQEGNLDWKLLGGWEYGQATGTFGP